MMLKRIPESELQRDLVPTINLFEALDRLATELDAEVVRNRNSPSGKSRSHQSMRPDKELDSLIEFFAALKHNRPLPTNPVKVKGWEDADKKLRLITAGEFFVSYVFKDGKWIFSEANRKPHI